MRTAEVRLAAAARVDRGAALLLQAALHEDLERATAAWDRLVADAGGPDGVLRWADAGAGRRLLPQLGQRAEVLELPARVATACRDATVEAWGLNERLLALVAPVLTDLIAAGVPVVALKGLALLGDVHPLHRLRPLGDVDLLVPRRALGRTLAVLADHGWASHDLDEPFLRTTRPGLNLGGPLAGPSIDVHWRAGVLVPHRPLRQPWPAADLEPVPPGHPLHGTGLLRAVPERLLVQVAAHGMGWTANSPHWLGDLALILRTHPAADAARVQRIAEADATLTTVLTAVRACRDLLGVAAPVLAAARPSPRRQRRELARWAAQARIETSYRERGLGPALRRLWLHGVRDAPGLRVLTRLLLLGVAGVNWLRSRGEPAAVPAAPPSAVPARRG